MACNVPVVATDVGDVAQVIAHTAGCAVSAGEPEAFAGALEQALSHTEPTDGRAAIASLSSEQIAREVIAMYEELVRRERRPVLSTSR